VSLHSLFTVLSDLLGIATDPFRSILLWFLCSSSSTVEALDKAIASGSYDEGAEDVFVDVEDEEEDDFGISGIVLEKTVAAEALGEIFEYTGPLFFPMVEPCVQAIKPLLSHYYGALKHAAGCTLLGFVRHQYNAMGAPAWTAGLLKSVSPSPNEMGRVVSNCPIDKDWLILLVDL
jgi:hypothetical protein